MNAYPPAYTKTGTQKPLLLIIAGPTAVGKTSVALTVARHFNTAILSADSRQCYKELNIGVARPTAQELATVPHYFVASHSIHDAVHTAAFEQYALNVLNTLFAKHSIVIATGGTGLYIKALTEGLDAIPEIPPSIRQHIIANYTTAGIAWLQQQLELKDNLYAAQGEMKNPQRMMRALEVVVATGRSIIHYKTGKKAARPFDILQVALEMPRSALYNRINERVDNMMVAGLEAEAFSLMPHRHLNALQTVGYKELFDYFDGKYDKQRAVELIQQNTRHYAKRQLTWFKKQPDTHWMQMTTPAEILRFIISLCHQH